MSRKKIVPAIDSDIKLIRKANEFVEARYKFDIWETRVFAYMLTMIKYTDTDFAEYKINVGDIVKKFDLSNGGFVYDEIKKASDKLLSKKVQIERTTSEGIVEILDTYLVVSTARLKEATKDNFIKLSFHPALKPFLLELQQRYLVYDIRNILSLTSIYTIRLFELLKQYQKIGKRRFEVDELKLLLSIEPNEYILYGHFKDRIIKRAQKDLYEHTDIYFEFKEEAEKKRVYAMTFFIYENKKNIRVKAIAQKNEEPETIIVQKTDNEDQFDLIYGQVSKYVSKIQVRKWLKDIAIEQVQNAITYTINYINAGNQVENIGGFLNTMVQTPNLFDKFEEKKVKAKKTTLKQQNNSIQIEAKIAELSKTSLELETQAYALEMSFFEYDVSLEEIIIAKIQKNQFYDFKKTIEENLKRPLIKGYRNLILVEMFPTYKALQDYYDNKIKTIQDELKRLGYRE